MVYNYKKHNKMRFVKAKYEIWKPKECNAKTIIESIERAAKVCYKSEVNIKEGSALPFVKGLIKRGHTSCLEHGAIYLRFDEKLMGEEWRSNLQNEEIIPYYYFIIRCIDSINTSIGFDDYRINGEYDFNNRVASVYTNARFVYEKCPKLFWDIILERPLPDFISLFTPKDNDPYRRQTVFFTSDQRITEEFIRHRVASPNKESTRYCCYASEKHNAELTYIIPPRLKNIINDGDKLEHTMYGDKLYWKAHDEIIKEEEFVFLLNTFSMNEICYNKMVNQYGWRAEEARIALPLGVKADLVLTNSLIDWCYGRPEPVDDYIPNIEEGEVEGKRIKGFFGLRCDSAAHPQARELAIPLMDDFKRNGWIEE